MDARDRAIRYLYARMCTCQQMKDYLKRKGHDAEEVDPLVDELMEYGYLDDLKYAQLFIEAGFEKGRGLDRIRRELRQKGVDGETIEQAENSIEHMPDELETALGIAERFLENIDRSQMDRKEIEKLKARLARRLAGRGYSSAVIYSIIGKLF